MTIKKKTRKEEPIPCVSCGWPVDEETLENMTPIERKEFEMSGLCRECQYEIFDEMLEREEREDGLN